MIFQIVQQENTLGSERLIEFSNGSKVKQKLEKIDDNKMIIGWRVVETDNKMLPVNSYAAKVFVKKNDDKTTVINYKAGFYRGFMGNDPPEEELNDENSKKKVQEFIKKSLKVLKKLLRRISIHLIFLFTISSFFCAFAKTDIAIITNQEANIVDIIDLKKKKSI